MARFIALAIVPALGRSDSADFTLVPTPEDIEVFASIFGRSFPPAINIDFKGLFRNTHPYRFSSALRVAAICRIVVEASGPRGPTETDMPADEKKFKHAPNCTLSTIAMVQPVEAGVWQTVNEGGDVNRLGDADFHRRCLPISVADTGEGVYAVIAPTELGVARRYVVNKEEKTVSLEGFEQDIDLSEFRKMAVRTTSEGRMIASLASRLTDQWNKCTESGQAQDHLLDIREMAECYVGSTDEFEQFDHHSYNLETSGMTDGLDFMQVMAKISAIGHPEGPTHVRFPLEEAFEGWREVRELEGYMKAPIRMAFDLFMRPMLGDFPDDRVTMMSVPRGDAQLSEMLEEAGFDLEGMLPPFEGRNVIPGYKTGDVAFHRARGVDVVVFSDFIGTYAYAWPTEEGGKYEMPVMNLRLGL